MSCQHKVGRCSAKGWYPIVNTRLTVIRNFLSLAVVGHLIAEPRSYVRERALDYNPFSDRIYPAF